MLETNEAPPEAVAEMEGTTDEVVAVNTEVEATTQVENAVTGVEEPQPVFESRDQFEDEYDLFIANIDIKLSEVEEQVVALKQTKEEEGSVSEQEYNAVKSIIDTELATIDKLLSAGKFLLEAETEFLEEKKEELISSKNEVIEILIPLFGVDGLDLDDEEVRQKLEDALQKVFDDKLASIESGDLPTEDIDLEGIGPDQQNLRKLVKEIAIAFAEGTTTLFITNTGFDAAALISFLLNPTGALSAGDYSLNSEKSENEVDHHLFIEKFNDPDLVGKSMYEFMGDKADEMGLSGWYSDNEDDLRSINDTKDVDKTIKVMISFFDAAFSSKASNPSKNLEIFKTGFTTALFGGQQDVSMGEDSVLYLNDLLEKQATGLKKLWKLDSDEVSDSPGDETTSDEDSTEEVSPDTTPV